MVAADRSHEAIAATGQGFDEARAVGGIAKSFAELVNRGIQTVVEINKGVGGPDLSAKLFAGDDFAGPLQQKAEDMERLILELDAHALFA